MSTLVDTTSTLPAAALRNRRLVSIRILGEHRLCLRFRDGFIAELDLASWLQAQDSKMTKPLIDEHFFGQVYLDHGVLTWPNSFDLDPATVRAWAEQGHCF